MSDEIQAALRREREKLGEIAQGRIIVVTAFIEAQAGDKAGKILGSLVTAEQVEGYERMMASFARGAICYAAGLVIVWMSFARTSSLERPTPWTASLYRCAQS
jgi:hypothetical protein